MKTIELNPAALTGTIDVLWGEQMIPVVNRVYSVIDRVSKGVYEQGKADGLAQGQRDAAAVPATLNPITPEDLYGASMWPPITPRETPFLKMMQNAAEYQPGAPDFGTYDTYDDANVQDSGDAQPVHEGQARLSHDELMARDVFGDDNACGRSSALCTNFPGCGCIS
jgi:hypothetical protein